MEKVEFTVNGLNGEGRAQDLANAVIGISGVAGVESDEAGHKLIVEYDPILTSEAMLKDSIEDAGYPVDKADGVKP